jgi:FlaA1/EpsC-like NDP-sugar epimerase
MKMQFKNPHFYLMLLGDGILFAGALVLAYLFRFEFSLDAFFARQLRTILIPILLVKLCTFFLFDLYKGMWRYTSTRDFWRLLQASAASTLLIMAFIFIFYRFEGGYSRAIFLMDGGLTFLFTGGLRMAIRTFYVRHDRNGQALFVPPAQRKRILIVGAGDAGEKILREIIENDHLPYSVVGFIDDDPKKHGRSIHGIPVLGSLNELATIIEGEEVREVLIAIPSATGDQIRRIVTVCKGCQIAYKTLPGIGEIIDGRVSIKALRDVNYEDLLGRTPVELDMGEIRDYLNGKTVLVTGCGGSIGAEL